MNKNKAKMKVLAIGPRSESEIFSIIAAGFSPENITGVDLISYTPLIEQGDMHDLPYEDESFDVVLAGWVMAYSNNNPQCAAEFLRVGKPGAYIAVGCAYSPPERTDRKVTGTNISGTRFSSVEDITQHFEDQISHVVFRGDPSPELGGRAGQVTVIMRKKTDAGAAGRLNGKDGAAKLAQVNVAKAQKGADERVENAAKTPDQGAAKKAPSEKVEDTPAKTEPKDGDLEKRIGNAVKQARTMFADGDFVGAEETLRAIEEIAPEETRHLLVLGNALAMQGKYAESEAYFRRAVEDDPSNKGYVERLADAVAAQGRHAEAADLLQEWTANAEKPEAVIARRIINHRHRAGILTDELRAERDHAVEVWESSRPALSAEQQRVLDELSRSGIAASSVDKLFGSADGWEEAQADFSGFRNRPEVSELCQRIAACEDFDSDLNFKGVFKPSVVNFRTMVHDISAGSALAELYSSRALVDIANAYNGMASKLRNVHMWINPPLHPKNTATKKGSQLWHRDQEDEKILKCFIYFSDVDLESGATEYLKHSAVTCREFKYDLIPFPNSTGYVRETSFDRRTEEADRVAAEGPKGTVVFLDTNGFHRGGYVKSHERLIGMATFLRPISPYVPVNTKLDAKGVDLGRFDKVAAYAVQ